MLRTTLGNLLVNDALPEDLRDYKRVLDKKGLSALLREIAEKRPDEYPALSKRLADVGREVATITGGNSFGLAHLIKAQAGRRYQQQLRTQIKKILDADNLTDKQRHDLIIRAAGAIQSKQMDEILAESLQEENPLARQVISGSRGNKMNLASLRGSDVLYADARDNPVPLPIDRSYSEGLSPVQYVAGSYGARKGTVDVKLSTASAGYYGKLANRVAHRLLVTADDDEEADPALLRGLPVDTDDLDNEGALLARDTGPYKRNTVLTPKIIKHLRATGHERILVRSPAVGGAPDGGVYARDVGVREYGTLPGRFEPVGFVSAQSLSEPVSQGSLGSKHSGGVAGQTKAVSGFPVLEQHIQASKQFRGGASHAQADGRVSRIEPAPAGGFYVWIEGVRHYVPQGLELKVKRGDPVEAGDVLSAGVPDMNQIVAHKGVGEGRRYFANSLRQAMSDAGIRGHRRNLELLARGLINHVRLTDEHVGHVPDDVLSYSTLEHTYEPRDGHEVVQPARALGRYLERPVLHYSIGTKIRPSVLKDLQHFKVKDVAVHREPPPFVPEMVRGSDSLGYDPDWMTRFYGSGLKKSLLDSIHRGGTSTELGTSFVPGLARAVDFGDVGLVRPPEPGIKPEEIDVARKQRPSPALDLPERTAPRGSMTSRIGSLFKFSTDQATCLREARALIAKVAGDSDTRVTQSKLRAAATDGTHQSNPGSSTTGTNGQIKTLAGQAGQAPKPTAVQPVDHKQPALAAPPQPPPPGQPNYSGGPQVHGAPDWPTSTPGDVHPARLGGYQPGRGLMGIGEDPELMQRFVAGGGNINDPDSGFGGSLGAVMRYGSLLDQNAIAALTAGPSGYVPGPARALDPRIGPEHFMPGGGVGGYGPNWTGVADSAGDVQEQTIETDGPSPLSSLTGDMAQQWRRAPFLATIGAGRAVEGVARAARAIPYAGRVAAPAVRFAGGAAGIPAAAAKAVPGAAAAKIGPWQQLRGVLGKIVAPVATAHEGLSLAGMMPESLGGRGLGNSITRQELDAKGKELADDHALYRAWHSLGAPLETIGTGVVAAEEAERATRQASRAQNSTIRREATLTGKVAPTSGITPTYNAKHTGSPYDLAGDAWTWLMHKADEMKRQGPTGQKAQREATFAKHQALAQETANKLLTDPTYSISAATPGYDLFVQGIASGKTQDDLYAQAVAAARDKGTAPQAAHQQGVDTLLRLRDRVPFHLQDAIDAAIGKARRQAPVTPDFGRFIVEQDVKDLGSNPVDKNPLGLLQQQEALRRYGPPASSPR